jgi:hypothetical protein
MRLEVGAVTRTLATFILIFVFLSGTLNGNVHSWLSANNTTVASTSSSWATRPARSLSISEVWAKNTGAVSLGDIGRGKGIIFSPDLSEPGNRAFFTALGFGYFEDPDWRVVLDQIKTYNQSRPERRIEVLLIQSHGTQGDGLKLQNGKQPDAPRSYISLAALQEKLEGTGVRTCLLAACNAGRLFRPEAYQAIHPDPNNPLFEPPTLGIINAAANFDPSRSTITLARRVESHLELINECRVSEVSPAARAELARSGDPSLKATTRIAVPEMLIQLLLQDERLHLISWGYEVEKSKAETNDNAREQLISRFLNFVNRVAAQDDRAATGKSS